MYTAEETLANKVGERRICIDRTLSGRIMPSARTGAYMSNGKIALWLAVVAIALAVFGLSGILSFTWLLVKAAFVILLILASLFGAIHLWSKMPQLPNR